MAVFYFPKFCTYCSREIMYPVTANYCQCCYDESFKTCKEKTINKKNN